MATLWKCDDGTFDIVGEDGEISHFNIPERQLAAAPILFDALEEMLNAFDNDTPKTISQLGAIGRAWAAIRKAQAS